MIANVLIAEHGERNISSISFSFSRFNMDFRYIKDCIPAKTSK
jgi:hypothetical protein